MNMHIFISKNVSKRLLLFLWVFWGCFFFWGGGSCQSQGLNRLLKVRAKKGERGKEKRKSKSRKMTIDVAFKLRQIIRGREAGYR